MKTFGNKTIRKSIAKRMPILNKPKGLRHAIEPVRIFNFNTLMPQLKQHSAVDVSTLEYVEKNGIVRKTFNRKSIIIKVDNKWKCLACNSFVKKAVDANGKETEYIVNDNGSQHRERLMIGNKFCGYTCNVERALPVQKKEHYISHYKPNDESFLYVEDNNIE